MNDFAGKWQSTFGPMELVQEGNAVRGYYWYRDTRCPIDGTVNGKRLTFTYEEGPVQGEGWWDLAPKGQSFRGQWRVPDDTMWRPWVGTRVGFDGVWQTDFGRMRLVADGSRVHGFYEIAGGSIIDGQCTGSELQFTYREPDVQGEGRFVLADDGMTFMGEWHAVGTARWMPWQGVRVRPGNQTWLVILEVPWHAIAADRDYSFGAMLREFFSRQPEVRVRQRFFTNEQALRRQCRELALVAEPVVLVIATHGQPKGIPLDGSVVDAGIMEECLREVPDLRLVHFSACLLMQDAAVVEAWRSVAQRGGFAISGYSTSVDWAASAIIEFTYLDLVLARGMPPALAAEQLLQLLPFAGDSGEPGVAFAPAGFRLVGP
jgi:hypothetical protein